MKTEIKLITPLIAGEILKRNTLNRKFNEKRCNEYTRLMSVGLWKENTGEAIKIAYDGTLLDGQHRLVALIRAGVSLEFLLITDLEKEIFTVIDTGATRSGGDIFHIAKVTQPNNHASVITKYLMLKEGRSSMMNAGGSNLKEIKYSKAELFSIYNNRIKFWDAVVTMSNQWHSKIQTVLSISEIGGLHAYFYDIDENDSFTFIDALCNGTGLETNNPIRLLREKLILSRMNKQFKLISTQKLALIFKTCNYFRDKKSMSILRYSSNLESFPIPK